MVCKIAFCSEFPDIPDSSGRKTRRRRKRRAKTIAKRYAFDANAIMPYKTLRNLEGFLAVRLFLNGISAPSSISRVEDWYGLSQSPK